MNKFRTMALFLVGAAAALQGCATKTYGRQGELTDYERQSMSCREIDLETAKVQGFIAYVHDDSHFDGRQMLAILGDFGVGNHMERNAALESANRRQSELRTLSIARNCPPPATAPPPTASASQPSV